MGPAAQPGPSMSCNPRGLQESGSRESDEEEQRGVGRIPIDINVEEVEFLRSLNLQWNIIAQIFGISTHTLYRRLKNEGILQDLQFTDISDSDLDDVLKQIKAKHPNDGEVLVMGHLIAKSLCVPRSRLRASIHRVDPVNTAEQSSRAVVRRIYNVGEPNEVWHFDGHHKLIRWRLVIYGCIDGYSRVITYLHCSTNNTSITVLSLFTNAVQRFGLPQKNCSDLGGENVDVWRYMIAQHEYEHVVITGSSTHNERIERLWRDVFRCVGNIFYDIFYSLEEEAALDPLNETDIFCLQYVFLPRINKCLHDSVECWNNHRLSSEHCFTPYQLFLTGRLEEFRTKSSQQHKFLITSEYLILLLFHAALSNHVRS